MTDDKALAKIEHLEQMLVVPEGQVVAIVHPQVAEAIYEGMNYLKPENGGETQRPLFLGGNSISIQKNQDGKTIMRQNPGTLLAGETVLGVYGAVGQVYVTRTHNDATLSGAVYIPRRVLQMAQLALDDDGLYAELLKNIGREEVEGNPFSYDARSRGSRQVVWDITSQTVDLDQTLVGNVPFLQKGYYWKVQSPDTSIFDNPIRNLDEQVRACTDILKDYISQFDAYIAAIDPRRRGEEITPDIAREAFTGQKSLPPGR